MKKIFKLIIAGALFVAFNSCASKQDPLDDLRDLAVELQEESAGYTEADWNEAARKYSEIEKDLGKYEYTDDELMEIGRLKARCGRAAVSSAFKSIGEGIDSVMKQVEGAVSEIGED